MLNSQNARSLASTNSRGVNTQRSPFQDFNVTSIHLQHP